MSTALSFNCGYTDGRRDGARYVAWYPTEEPEKEFGYGVLVGRGYVANEAEPLASPCPLVVFSHGGHSYPQQSLFLTEHLARLGYVVLATHHEDGNIPSFIDPGSWTEESCFHRKEDVSWLLDIAPDLFNLDTTPRAIIGHSMGGYTALAMGGGIRSWRDDRLNVVLALSPYHWPIAELGSFSHIKCPTMLQSGTRDLGILPTLDTVYDDLNGSKYFVVFRDVGHFTFSNTACLTFDGGEACIAGNPAVALIVGNSVAFLNRFVRGIESPLLLSGVSSFHGREKWSDK
jgi:predicted dienelactone hydrolase